MSSRRHKKLDLIKEGLENSLILNKINAKISQNCPDKKKQLDNLLPRKKSSSQLLNNN